MDYLSNAVSFLGRPRFCGVKRYHANPADLRHVALSPPLLRHKGAFGTVASLTKSSSLRQAARVSRITALCLLLISFTSRGQATAPFGPQGSTHTQGTVNVILANKNGLVAVTDSRLSSSGTPVGRGQKLFVVDDHTICSIAGFYSASGPSSGAEPWAKRWVTNYPAFVAVPSMIQQYLNLKDKAGHTLEEKGDSLARVFAFTLAVVADIGSVAGDPPPMEKSEITLSSFEGGYLKIFRADLTPHTVGQATVFEVRKLPLQMTSDRLIYAVAGIKDVALPFLQHPEKYNEADPFLNDYAAAIKADGGQSLTQKQLQQIAESLEAETAAAFPKLVGDARQIAQLTNGTASVLYQPFEYDGRPDPIPGIFFHHERMQIGGQEFGLAAHTPGGSFITNGIFSDLNLQPLDNLFFFRTTFVRCTLVFDGNQNFIFDRSNLVTDSRLMLVNPGDLQTSAVQRLIADFPTLPVVDKSGNPLK